MKYAPSPTLLRTASRSGWKRRPSDGSVHSPHDDDLPDIPDNMSSHTPFVKSPSSPTLPIARKRVIEGTRPHKFEEATSAVRFNPHPGPGYTLSGQPNPLLALAGGAAKMPLHNHYTSHGMPPPSFAPSNPTGYDGGFTGKSRSGNLTNRSELGWMYVDSVYAPSPRSAYNDPGARTYNYTNTSYANWGYPAASTTHQSEYAHYPKSVPHYGGNTVFVNSRDRLSQVSGSTRVGEATVIGERWEERKIRMPRKILREEIVEEEEIVREKVVEIAKPVIEEQIVEVPEIQYVEEIIPVPEKIVKDRVIEVPDFRVEERPVYVPKVTYDERKIVVPQTVYRDLPIKRQVHVPHVQEQIVTIDNPIVPQVREREVEMLTTVDAPFDVHVVHPQPFETKLELSQRIPKLVTANSTESGYTVYLPRIREVPINRNMISDATAAQIERERERILSTLQKGVDPETLVNELHLIKAEDRLTTTVDEIENFGKDNLIRNYDKLKRSRTASEPHRMTPKGKIHLALDEDYHKMAEHWRKRSHRNRKGTSGDSVWLKWLKEKLAGLGLHEETSHHEGFSRPCDHESPEKMQYASYHHAHDALQHEFGDESEDDINPHVWKYIVKDNPHFFYD